MTTIAEVAGQRPGGGAERPAAGRFLALDGLRGVAAFAVILDHVPGSMINDFLPGRALSVDFFFTLSGFVLAHAYGVRLCSGMSALAFMRQRLIRFYPLYLLGLLIALPLAVYGVSRGRWSGAELAVVVAFGLLFLPAPPLTGSGRAPLYPLDGPAWSLLFELIVNFVYGLVARFLSLRLLAYLLPVGAVAVVITIFRHAGDIGPGWLWVHFDAGLARVLYDFFTGVFLYHLCERWRPPTIPAWLAAVLFLTIVGVPLSGLWRPAFDSAAAIVMFPLLILVSARARVSGVAARICAGLGLMSYAVYVIHVPLLGLLSFGVARTGIQLPGPVFVALVVLTAGGAAALADAYYDTPLRRWLTARLVRRKPAVQGGEHG